jgi:glycosyltransferase involved in cell wall biosynthesis
MASGTPTITTSLGLSGLDVRKDKDLLVSDTASKLSEEALRLCEDSTLYQRLSQNGREQVEDKYDWVKIGKTLEEVYFSVVA